MNRLHRVWQRITLGQTPDDCWSYEGSHAGLYPTFWDGERTEYVHRLMYELYKGPIPIGTEVDHLCRNEGCPNPRHLEAVTHQINNQRGFWGTKPTCPQGHPLDGTRKDGQSQHRYCLTCNRTRAARNRVKRAA